MATITSSAPAPLTAAPITCAQPGGGFFMGLELTWGRWRRWYLRRFRPGYVRAMLDKRQGECASCPHDIIDPRDLKFYRNVCGYWFRDEDDRFRWRGRLRLARAGLAELIGFSAILWFLMAACAAASLIHWAFLIPTPLILGLWIFIVLFFRDPERKVPDDPSVVVSPADGTITDVGEVDEPDFPGGRAFRIGMFLSVFNVHVNRIPRSGRVTNLRYYPGEFLDARHGSANVRNEQLWIDLEEEGSGRHLRVKQISGAIARRIVCWLKLGEAVKIGERLGMIKFGSRTELFLPTGENIEILVKVGDVVKGASSELLRYRG
jgi:phosphatidylserine decarboxylase